MSEPVILAGRLAAPIPGAWCDQGTARLIPQFERVAVDDGGDGDSDHLAGPSTITLTVDAEGWLTLDGSRSIELVDLGSGDVNPRVPRDRAAWQIEFHSLAATIGGKAVDVRMPAFAFHPLPGENDLADLAPLLTGCGVAITRGQQGPPGPPGSGSGGGALPEGYVMEPGAFLWSNDGGSSGFMIGANEGAVISATSTQPDGRVEVGSLGSGSIASYSTPDANAEAAELFGILIDKDAVQLMRGETVRVDWPWMSGTLATEEWVTANVPAGEPGVGLTPGTQIEVPADQPWVSVTTEDDGTPSASWPDRLAFFFKAAGGAARKVFSLNEYYEPRINARASTVAFRIFEREYPTDPAHTAAVPLMEVQDDRTARVSKWQLLTGGRTVQAGDATIGGKVAATNLPPGFLTLGPTDPIPGGTPAGTWILRRAT